MADKKNNLDFIINGLDKLNKGDGADSVPVDDVPSSGSGNPDEVMDGVPSGDIHEEEDFDSYPDFDEDELLDDVPGDIGMEQYSGDEAESEILAAQALIEEEDASSAGEAGEEDSQPDSVGADAVPEEEADGESDFSSGNFPVGNEGDSPSGEEPAGGSGSPDGGEEGSSSDAVNPDGTESGEGDGDDPDDPYGNYDLEDYDSDFLDPEDEARELSRDPGSLSSDILFAGGDSPDSSGPDSGSDSGEDEEYEAKKKKAPEDVLEGMKKGKRKIPKLAKTKVLVILGCVTLLCMVVFNMSFLSGKGVEDEKKTEEDVMVGGYKPDFGDYQNRQYKPTAEDQKKSDLDYINRMIGDGSLDDKGKAPPPQPQPQPQPQYQQQPVSSEAVSSWTQARDSPIKYSGSGFGSRNDDRKKGVFSDIIPGMPYGDTSGASYPSPQNMTYDQYADNYVNRLQKLAGAAGGQSGQDGMWTYDRVNNGRYSQDGRYDRNAEGGQLSAIPENSLYPGTIIPAVMVSGINTDYPGNITARIISPVYDSRTGKRLLIPQGSILRGSYSSSSIGIAKVQIAWQTLIINRGGRDYMVNLGSMVGVDARGYSGIKGSLNDHFFQYVKAAGISSLFTYINSNIYSYTKAQKSATKREMIADAQDIGNRLADKLLDRALDIQPTVIVKPGTRVYVDVDKVLTLVPQDIDVPVSRYVRD